MSAPRDPLEALDWAWNHWDHAWWLIGAVGVGLAWARKRIAQWSRQNSVTTGGRASARQTAAAAAATAAAARPGPAATTASAAYAAAPSYSAAGYSAQPAYAAPAPAAAPRAPAPPPARKLYRETPSGQRAVTPVARSVDVPAGPAPTGRWTLAGAFGDPAHARTAIVVAEVLGTPPGLR